MAKKSKLERAIDKLNITEEEAVSAIKSAQQKPNKVHKLSISGKSFLYGYISDAHIGHEKFHPELLEKASRVFKREKVDFIVNPGDHVEGMSGRPGHIYELTHIGFQKQIEYATEMYSLFSPTPHYGIDGNHDQWYFKKGDKGVVVGDELEHRVKGYKNLGQDEATIQVTPSVDISLFHGNDGSAYALSYKLQKLVESFSGGEKPAIVHSGHYHKAMYMFLRNVHAFESATLMGQSRWMRGKKIQAHMGFGLVRVYYDKHGVDSLEHRFFPHYERE